ncbi:MAG: hypothetical protein C0407_18065, partial [Desulfobacca sp.]|nr:hypothetical protein [Desulfobacca sp.]
CGPTPETPGTNTCHAPGGAWEFTITLESIMLTTQKDPISEDFIETVRESFLVLDPDLKILKANRNFYHTFMVTPKETIGHLIYDLGKGQWDIPQLRRLFEYLLLKTNKIDNFEIQHVFPNLGEKIMLVNACRIIHKKFVPEMILLAIEDITERRRPAGSLDGTEHNKDKEARRKSEERYRTIADFTYNWEYWLAPNQKFLYCSPSCQRITGYSREDFLKDPKLLYKIIHPDDQGIMAGHSHEISEKGEVVPIDFRIIDRTGQEHWISHVCYPVVRVDGRPLGHRASNQDVTERKLAEEALRRVKEEWERTFDSVPDLIAILDHQHRIVRANKAMAERLGCLTTACAGLICYEQVHGMDAPPAYCPHTRTLGDGQEHFAEIQEACLGGDFLVTTTPILDAQ